MEAGDWVISKVELPYGRVIKAKSYILFEGDDCYVTIGSKKYKGVMFIVPKENVTPMKVDVEEEDIHALINLALDTNDKKWFDELHQQLAERSGQK